MFHHLRTTKYALKLISLKKLPKKNCKNIRHFLMFLFPKLARKTSVFGDLIAMYLFQNVEKHTSNGD